MRAPMLKRSLISCATLTVLALSVNLPADAEPDSWALTGVKIYTRPEVPPIEDGVVLVRKNQIVALGTKRAIKISADTPLSDCSGGIVTAGFYNNHVHFAAEQWNDAANQPAEVLSRQLSEMLSRYGVTTAVDAASIRANTLALRARIASGAVIGPHLLTAGLPLYPPQGIPFYLAGLPREILDMLPQPATPSQAVGAIRQNLDAGTDASKLFIATPQRGDVVKRMPAEVASAVAAETHQRGKLVLAHPTDTDGVRAAVAAGVDILMHTTIGEEQPWPADLIEQMIKRRMALVPTLKLQSYEFARQGLAPEVARRLLSTSVENLRAFNAGGGEVLFGTDIGYMSDYDPTDEYALLSRAGLTAMQILAALTTGPAARWKTARRGYLAKGMDADLVVLDADPATQPQNFAKVRCTFLSGVPTYKRTP